MGFVACQAVTRHCRADTAATIKNLDYLAVAVAISDPLVWLPSSSIHTTRV